MYVPDGMIWAIFGIVGTVVVGSAYKIIRYAWTRRSANKLPDPEKCLHADPVRRNDGGYDFHYLDSGPGTIQRWCLRCGSVFASPDHMMAASNARIRELFAKHGVTIQLHNRRRR